MNFPFKVFVFLLLIIDLSAMKWSEKASRFESNIQKLMFINTSGLQTIGLGDLFSELNERKLAIETFKLEVRSHDGKGRLTLFNKGMKFSYPIAVPLELSEIEIPVPKQVERLSDLELRVRGSFYIKKAKLDYNFSDKVGIP